MSETISSVAERNPVDVLAEHFRKRTAAIEYLCSLFEPAMELVTDMNAVNDILAQSDRPELVMTRRIAQKQDCSPTDINGLNNFIPNMSCFGVPVNVPDDFPLAREGDTKTAGYRPYTDAELSVVKQLSGRGGYYAYREFVENEGIDTEFAEEVCSLTHIDKEAFARMWIVVPKFTDYVMSACLKRVEDPSNKQTNEELYAAYSVMSYLVDEKDHNAQFKRDDDAWALCH